MCIEFHALPQARIDFFLALGDGASVCRPSTMAPAYVLATSLRVYSNLSSELSNLVFWYSLNGTFKEADQADLQGPSAHAK